MNPDSNSLAKELIKAEIRRLIAGICATCGSRVSPETLKYGECEACRRRAA